MSEDIRTALHDVMTATLSEEQTYHDWEYLAVRPRSMPSLTRSLNKGYRKTGDCSKGVQFLCWWVPTCLDPMGRNWDPYGNSQTLCFHLHHVGSPGELWVGDIVTFGSWGDAHAAMVMEKGDDPLLWSFGHQGAPNKYRLSYDRRPKQFLRLPVPATPMTPQEHLRAMTGWFSWVAWRLGEGPWVHYGPHKASVRPNVPKVIPRVWWTQLAVFLANRKKGNKPTTQHLVGRSE